MVEFAENEIIRRLMDIPAGEVYFLSSRQYFFRGYEYYKAGRLIQLQWSKDYGTLTALVQGSRVYTVSFFVEEDILKFGCNCPAWQPGDNCKHVVCALVAVKNILNPDFFNVGRQSDINQASFRTSLLTPDSLDKRPANPESAEKNKASVYSILIEKKKHNPLFDVTVQKNNAPVIAYYHSLPRELHRIAKDCGNYYADKGRALLLHLEKNGNAYPLFFKTGAEKVSIEWNPSLVLSSRTGLDAVDGKVTLSRLCVSDNKISPGPHHLWDRFVVDLETRRLAILEDRSGWHAWRLFKERLREEAYYEPWRDPEDDEYYHTGSSDEETENINIPLKKFEKMQFVIADDNEATIEGLALSVNGEDAVPLTVDPHYCMTVEEHGAEKDNLVLKACRNIDGFKGATTRSFFGVLSSISRGLFISGALRASKRRSVLVDAFVRLLSIKDKNKAAGIIKDALSDELFSKDSIKKEARRLLTEAFVSLNKKTSRIQFHDGRWCISENDRDREALLYTIPSGTFGSALFDGITNHNEFTLSAEALSVNLPALYHGLKAHDIALFFKGKPVEAAKWDFSFDLTRGNTIDWFEIRPEIRCNGEAIDKVLFQKALARRGVIEKGDFVQVLDSNSIEIIRQISSIYGATNKRRPKDIVRVPRLQILDWMHLRGMGVKISLPKEDEAVIERLNRFERIESRPTPEGLKAKLRPYQSEGYYWLSFLYEHRFGACLADDMGLGKTLQAITLLGGIKEGKVRPAIGTDGPHLVVLPPSLLFNWESELGRFYPGIKMHFYTGKERKAEFEDADVVLTTYGLVRRDIEKLKEKLFHVIVFDEAQAIKNIHADTTGAVRQLRGYFKLAMTGTPVENHLGEYYSILDLSLPGLLGEYDDFKSNIRLESSPSLEVILRRTRPFVLRRTKEAVLKDLPPKTESDIYLELTDKQKALYKKTVEAVRSTITRAYSKNTEAQARIIALTAILKLRQICVSPKLIGEAFNEPSPKIEFLIGKLKELLDEGHSALVFSQFTSFLDILEEDLSRAGMSFCRLDGSTEVKRRKAIVEGFQNGDGASIFLLSLKAGGQGLNLTRASYVFHLDPWWNPAVENQASDRAHRIGQKNKVSIMRILMRHTIEEKMMELKEKKLSLYKAVMGDGMGRKKGLPITKSDFDYLLSP